VQFAQRGFSSVVCLDERPAGSDQADLAIRSTDSRNDSPEVARSKVVESCGLFLQQGRALVFKKVDSTLRGNLWPEIEAAMTKCGFPLAIVAPAFPAMGRTVEGGWLQRRTGATSQSPVHLPTILQQQGGIEIVHLDRSVLRAGLQALIKRLQNLAPSWPQVAVLDAVSEEDLSLIAQAAGALDLWPLAVGSAGLAAGTAGVLAERFGRQSVPASNDMAPANQRGPVVVFIGSTDALTVAQVEYLLSNRPANRVVLRRQEGDIARRTLQSGCHLVVVVALTEDDEDRVAQFWTLLAELPVRGLILSGGDTAHRICQGLKVSGIRLEREIVPGLPWGRFIGGVADRWPVATKAGGFGEKEALAVVADFLAACEPL
jgi:uncharacterized protein YgbK (DUF1537 family)